MKLKIVFSDTWEKYVEVSEVEIKSTYLFYKSEGKDFGYPLGMVKYVLLDDEPFYNPQIKPDNRYRKYSGNLEINYIDGDNFYLPAKHISYNDTWVTFSDYQGNVKSSLMENISRIFVDDCLIYSKEKVEERENTYNDSWISIILPNSKSFHYCVKDVKFDGGHIYFTDVELVGKQLNPQRMWKLRDISLIYLDGELIYDRKDLV